MKENGMGKNPYAVIHGGRIEAPNKPKAEPKANGIRSAQDLRK